VSWTPEKNGYIPAAPIARVVEQWAMENWWLDHRAKELTGKGTTTSLAEFVGLHEDTIRHLRDRKNEWMEFDMADRIVTYIDPWLWRRDDELREIYENFNFTHLDIARPTSRQADELALLNGVSDRAAATILGVSQSALNRQRKVRRKRERAAA